MTSALKNLKKLRKEAITSCKFRGHSMMWDYAHFYNTERAVQCGECINCGKTVAIDTKPAPNGIDIGGNALALNCKD